MRAIRITIAGEGALPICSCRHAATARATLAAVFHLPLLLRDTPYDAAATLMPISLLPPPDAMRRRYADADDAVADAAFRR